MYGGGVMTDQMCQKWFENFCAGDFLLDDALQSSRLVKADSQQTEALIDNNQHYTMWEIADILKINKVIGENEKKSFILQKRN